MAGQSVIKTIIPIAMLLAIVMISPSFATAKWGETFGPVSATVDRGDRREGLAIRSGPSFGSSIVGYVSTGGRITAHGDFSRGWVRVREPYGGGWAPIDYLDPRPVTAVVTGIDRPEMCLRIRSGPSTNHAIIGCLGKGARVELTGVWSENNWAELAHSDGGWVYGPQISCGIHPFTATAQVAAAAVPVAGYYRDPPVVVERHYYGKPRRYWGKRRYRVHEYYDNRPIGKYRRYRAREYYTERPYKKYGRYGKGYGVRVGPRGAVGYRGKGFAVGVGPRGGVGVRVGRFGVGVGPHGGVRFRVGGRRW